MLGEIFGRKAGLACTEFWLLRFLGSLDLNLESRLLTPIAVGEAMAPICGLGNDEPVAVIGALTAPCPGVFPTENVGVALTFASVVLMGRRTGFLLVLTGSGKTMSSMICSMSASAAAVCSSRLEVCRG